MTEGLTAVQSDQFLKLAENVEFDGDFETLREKLDVIKEAHFKVSSSKTRMVNEDSFIEEENNKGPVNEDPDIEMLAGLISPSPFKR